MESKKIYQISNPEKFFEKYGFTQSYSKPHPDFKDDMEFHGLESHYVNMLERRLKHLEEYIDLQNQKIDFLMNKEFYKWKDYENKKIKDKE